MKKIFLVLSLITLPIYAQTVRYVSNEGSNTPPYTSWETASDKIMTVLDICDPNDTIMVGAGEFYGTITVDKKISIKGVDNNQTIIRGASVNDNTIFINAKTNLENISFVGIGNISDFACILYLYEDTLTVKNCKFEDSAKMINNIGGWAYISYCDFKMDNYCGGLTSGIENNAKKYLVENSTFTGESEFSNLYGMKCDSIIMRGNRFSGALTSNLYVIEGSKYVLLENNVFSSIKDCVEIHKISGNVIIRNNLFHNFADESDYALDVREADTLHIYNNIFYGNKKSCMVRFDFDEFYSDYNSYYENENLLYGIMTHGENDIFNNPMFLGQLEKYQFPDEEMIRLQKYSPCIDAGKPDIFDVDGSRSDIGPNGGSKGNTYNYIDLPPAKPSTPFLIDSNPEIPGIAWDSNTENDVAGYKIFLDTTANFHPSPDNYFVSVDSNVCILDGLPGGSIYLKIKAIDIEDNESEPSEGLNLITTSMESDIRPSSFLLSQNFPNPFNPATKLTFSLPVECKVKISLYNMLGERVIEIVDAHYNAGYHELDLNINNLTSGTYLYSMSALGSDGSKFADTRKMMLLK